MNEKASRKRHLAKAVTWRIIASITTFTITYFITGDVKDAGVVAVLESVLKMALYYYHERAWFRFSKLGRNKNEA